MGRTVDDLSPGSNNGVVGRVVERLIQAVSGAVEQDDVRVGACPVTQPKADGQIRRLTSRCRLEAVN